MNKSTSIMSSLRVSDVFILAMLVIVFVSCEINSNEVEGSFANKIENYYNSIIPQEFPKLDLNDTKSSIVIWNSPNTYSYLINSDTIYSDPDNDRSRIELELLPNTSPSTYRFKSSDSIVGNSFVNNDIDSRTGEEYFQMNIYESQFYLSDPNNSELDYLPVLIHECAHMTERSTVEEQLDKTDFSPFPLIMLFEADTIFRRQIIGENELLLEALNSTKEEVPEILIQYFEAQKMRMDAQPDSVNVIEHKVEASEGYGRYIEYLCKIDLDSLKLNEITDLEIKVPQYNLSEERFMFDASVGIAYMYATGFNKIRLLMKFNNLDFLEIYRGEEENNLDPYLREILKGHDN